jgi:hypothetical protein
MKNGGLTARDSTVTFIFLTEPCGYPHALALENPAFVESSVSQNESGTFHQELCSLVSNIVRKWEFSALVSV